MRESTDGVNLFSIFCSFFKACVLVMREERLYTFGMGRTAVRL